MMGPEPNVWTPSNTQDALPSLNFQTVKALISYTKYLVIQRRQECEAEQ